MTKKVSRYDWSLKDKLEKIITKNCKEIPYEGTEVDRHAIIDEIMELLTATKDYSLLRHSKNTR